MTNLLELNLAEELQFLQSENNNVSTIIDEALEDQKAATAALVVVRDLSTFIADTKAKLEEAKSTVKIIDKLDTITAQYELNIEHATSLVEKAKADPLYEIGKLVQSCATLDSARDAKNFYASFETFLVEKRVNLGKICNSIAGRITSATGKEKTEKWGTLYRKSINDFIVDEFPESIRYQGKETHDARVKRACEVGKAERHEFMMKNSEGYRSDHEAKELAKVAKAADRENRRRFDNPEDAEEYLEGGEVAKMKFGIEDSPRRAKVVAGIQKVSKRGLETEKSDADMVAGQ